MDSTTKTYTVNLGKQDKDKKFGGVSGTFTIDETATPPSKDNIGWICPVCGRGVAPTEKFCPCTIRGKRVEINPIDDYPSTYPPNPYPIWWPQVPMFTDNWWWKQPKITTVTYKTTTKGSEDD